MTIDVPDSIVQGVVELLAKRHGLTLDGDGAITALIVLGSEVAAKGNPAQVKAVFWRVEQRAEAIQRSN